MNKPKYLMILITSECNLRCKHCHMWMNKDGDDILTLSEKIDVLKQFHAINPQGVVILCGGELMLKEEEFFELTRTCRSLKIMSLAATNASLLNQSNYERILIQGPNIISISLDGHIASIHDFVRGVKGSYEHVLNVIKELVKLKKNHPDCNTRIITSTVLFNENINYLSEFIDFVRNLGVDGAIFQTLHPTYQNKSTLKKDSFFSKHFFKDKKMAVEKINQVLKDNYYDDFLVTKPEDFQWMKLHILNEGKETINPVCGSHLQNIFMDEYGNYALCTNMHELKEIGNLGNIRSLSISDFWKSEETDKARKLMSKCTKSCGIINGNRKEGIEIPLLQNKQ